jgi:hypothetical protein
MEYFFCVVSPEAATAKICLQEVDHNIERIAGGINIDLVSDELAYRTAVDLKIKKQHFNMFKSISFTKFTLVRIFLLKCFGKKRYVHQWCQLHAVHLRLSKQEKL